MFKYFLKLSVVFIYFFSVRSKAFGLNQYENKKVEKIYILSVDRCSIPVQSFGFISSQFSYTVCHETIGFNDHSSYKLENRQMIQLTPIVETSVIDETGILKAEEACESIQSDFKKKIISIQQSPCDSEITADTELTE